jgi:MFS family permease
LLVSGLALGQITAGAAMAFMRIDRYHGRVLMAGCLAVLLMALLVAWSPWYALSFAAFVVSGFGMACFSTMQSSITLLWSPPEMRGRMMGLRSLCIGLGTPLGTLQIGLLAAALGTPWAVSTSVLAGLLFLLPALLLTPLVFRWRREAPGAGVAAGVKGRAILGEGPPKI